MLGSHGGTAGKPGIFTDVQTETQDLDVEHHRLLAGRKVSHFVEHPVVGEFVLAITSQNTTFSNHRSNVVQLTVNLPDRAHNDPHSGINGIQLRTELLEGLVMPAKELITQKQVFGGVPRECQFRRNEDVQALLTGPACAFYDFGSIRLQVTHARVDLSKADFYNRHGNCLYRFR